MIDYIIDKRIEFSKSDLSFTELALYEIAKKYGFTDATYFTKIFKSRIGTTPLKYRHQTKENRPKKPCQR